MIVKPVHEQYPGIQRLKISVENLEEAAKEALSTLFTEQRDLENASKTSHLKEIFKVAKAREKFLNGELGTYERRICTVAAPVFRSPRTPDLPY
jgi:hypothetical protein